MANTPQLIPLPTVQNDFDVIWPNPSANTVIGAAFDTGAGIRYSGLTTPLWTMNGGGTSNMALDPRGAYIGQVASVPLGQVRDATATAFQLRPILNKGGPSSVYKYPPQCRVFRVQFVFQLQAVLATNLGREVFLGLIPNGGAGPDAPGASYFGVVLSVGARWQWVSRAGGILFGFSDQVDLFPAATTPHTIDIEMVAATGGLDAILNLYVDGKYGAPFLTRTWAPGGVLPGYNATVVNATSWQMRVQAHDAAVTHVVQLLQARATVGQFLANGTQVF